MNLSKVQTIYFLLHATQSKNNGDDKINFDLIVKHEGKLLTANFLTIKSPFSPIIREKDLDYDGDEDVKELNLDYFRSIFRLWQSEIGSPFFTTSKAFNNPLWLLEKVSHFTDSIEDIPFITSRVSNLKYLESGLELKEAILDLEGYSIVSLVVH